MPGTRHTLRRPVFLYSLPSRIDIIPGLASQIRSSEGSKRVRAEETHGMLICLSDKFLCQTNTDAVAQVTLPSAITRYLAWGGKMLTGLEPTEY